jgi:hypothetical protein
MAVRSESEQPSESHLTVGSLRIDSTASDDLEHEPSRPRPRENTFYYVLGALATSAVAGIGWLCIDYGVDTKVPCSRGSAKLCSYAARASLLHRSPGHRCSRFSLHVSRPLRAKSTAGTVPSNHLRRAIL